MKTKKNAPTEVYMPASTISNFSFGLAAGDLILAAICAANGLPEFAVFMVLAILMWCHGVYYKSKEEKEGE